MDVVVKTKNLMAISNQPALKKKEKWEQSIA